jgi:hypothetical protein
MSIYKRLLEEAQCVHEQFMPNKAKSYKAGFDNGRKMGIYEGLIKAVKIVKTLESKNKISIKQMKQLKVAFALCEKIENLVVKYNGPNIDEDITFDELIDEMCGIAQQAD